jgi:hypothetical protein
MLQFMHVRLQEIKGNKLPFGGLNIICVGDLYQLQPVLQRFIFTDLTSGYGPLTTNLWKTYFTVFELTEIMRQKDDKPFAELLNRLRIGAHTPEDIKSLQACLVSPAESLAMCAKPHFFPTRAQTELYNNTVMKQAEGQEIIVNAIDSPASDVSTYVQNQLLAAAKNKNINHTGNLPYTLTLKVGQLYDIVANINVEDGIVNGAECYLRAVEPNPNNPKFPLHVWVEFTNEKIGAATRRKASKTRVGARRRAWTPIEAVRRGFIVKREQRVTRTQFPLQLSAGRTIHKAQSATYQEVVVDMATAKRIHGSFWEHMHYVAFSRCTSMKGLHIVNINPECIKTSKKVQQYLETDCQKSVLCYQTSYDQLNTITIAYNNVGSIGTKWNAISPNYNIKGCDALFLGETWLSGKDANDGFVLENYVPYRMDSKIVPGHRGMIMFTRSDAQPSRTKQHQTNHLEVSLCTVTKFPRVLLAIAIYRPPTAPWKCFLDDLKQFLRSVDMTQPFVLLGDFNMDVADERHAGAVADLEHSYSMKQLVNTPTTTIGTTIDLVFSNVNGAAVQVLCNTWSYHHTLFAHIPC